MLCNRQCLAFGQQLPGQFVRLLAVVLGEIHLSLQLRLVLSGLIGIRFFTVNPVIVERLLNGGRRVVRRLYVTPHLAGTYLNTNPDPRKQNQRDSNQPGSSGFISVQSLLTIGGTSVRRGGRLITLHGHQF